MSDKKQTAVEYLHYEFMKVFGELEINTSLYYDLVNSFSKAKAMEKEQIAEAYYIGDKNGCGCYDYCTKEDSEQYYKETYEQ